MLLGDFPIPLRRALRRRGAVLAGALGGGMEGVSPAGGEAESPDETGETSLGDSGVSLTAVGGLESGVGKDWDSGVSDGESNRRLNLAGRGVLPAVVCREKRSGIIASFPGSPDLANDISIIGNVCNIDYIEPALRVPWVHLEVGSC